MAGFSIALTAYSMGLGTCLVASFHAEAVKKILHLPEHIVPRVIVSVGYPIKFPKAPPRKIEGNYFFDTYGTEVKKG